MRFSLQAMADGFLAFLKAHRLFSGFLLLLFLSDVFFWNATFTFLTFSIPVVIFGFLLVLLIAVGLLLVLLFPVFFLLFLPLYGLSTLAAEMIGFQQVTAWPKSKIAKEKIADALRFSSFYAFLRRPHVLAAAALSGIALIAYEFFWTGWRNWIFSLSVLFIVSFIAVVASLLSVLFLGRFSWMRETKNQAIVFSSLVFVPFAFLFAFVLAYDGVFNPFLVVTFTALCILCYFGSLLAASLLDWLDLAGSFEEGLTKPKGQVSAHSYGLLFAFFLLPPLIALGFMALFGLISLDQALNAFEHLAAAMAKGEAYS